MRRVLVVLLSVIAGVAFTMASASAVPPTSTTRDGGLHFVGRPNLTVVGSVEEGTVALRATGEVAGAGTTATATLSADAVVTTGCINRGAQDQQPSGLQRETTTVLGSQEFNTRQGRGTFDVTTNAITLDRICPDQMTPVLVSVEFTNIVLTVTSQTGTITATFPDQTAS